VERPQLQVHPFCPHEAALMLPDLAAENRALVFAATGRLGYEIVAVGPWWTSDGRTEIDAVALTGRARTRVLVGEAKWARRVDGNGLVTRLRRHAAQVPGINPDAVRTAVCARTEIGGHPAEALTITAADIMPGA
jgi:Archaea bacterial proteins of unknown function